MNKKGGFASIVFIILGVVVLGVGSYLFFRKPVTAPSVVLDAGWKTYRSEQYGFEVKYPSNWNVNDENLTSFTSNNLSLQIESPLVYDIPSYEKAGAIFLLDLELNDPTRIGHSFSIKVKDPKNETMVILPASDSMLVSSAEYKIAQDIITSAQLLDLGSDLISKNNWGVSFMRASDWRTTVDTDNQVVLQQVSGQWKGDKIKIDYFSGERIFDESTKFGDVTYWYDSNQQKWMTRLDEVHGQNGTEKPANLEAVRNFLKVNFLVFSGTGRSVTYIIPLSHTTFLKLNISGSGNPQALTDLVKTIKFLKTFLVPSTNCKDEVQGTPVITSITPISGGVGSKVEIQGCNFSGFEGDKTVWIENSAGVKAILAGDPGSTAKLLKLTLRSPLCQSDTSYSGLPCDAWLTLTPGVYKIYTEPWGKKSNEVNFVVQ